MKLNNKYYLLRHGQAISNVKKLCSCWPEKFHNPLTKVGREEVAKLAKTLADRQIDFIFCSPLLRAEQTAGIVGKFLKIKPKTNKRLREIGFGIFNNCQLEAMWKYFVSEEKRINQAPPKGETYKEILKRMTDFLKQTDKKYKGKNILIVSHEGPLFLLQGKIMGLSFKETIEEFPMEKRIHKAEIRELN